MLRWNILSDKASAFIHACNMQTRTPITAAVLALVEKVSQLSIRHLAVAFLHIVLFGDPLSMHVL